MAEIVAMPLKIRPGGDEFDIEDGETRRTSTWILLLLVIEREEEKWRREEQRVEVERTSIYGGGWVSWTRGWLKE